MPAGAYRDQRKTQYVLARNCTAADINKIFYCETIGCDATMELVAYGSDSQNPYFRCIHPHSHSANCVPADNGFDVTDYTDVGLDIPLLIDNLCKTNEQNGIARPRNHPRGPGQRRPPNQFRTLYNCLKAHSIYEEYAGQKVMKWLIDGRIPKIYNPFSCDNISCFPGYHIVECHLFKVDSEALIFFMTNVITGASNINLRCKNIKMFNTLRKYMMLHAGKILTSEQQRQAVYAVAGDWYLTTNKEYTNILTDIQSKRQIISVKV